jgi:hypothetical protein
VFLVVFVTAAGGAVRDYAVREISQFAGADLNVRRRLGRHRPAARSSRSHSTSGIDRSVAVYL